MHVLIFSSNQPDTQIIHRGRFIGAQKPISYLDR